MVNHLIPQDENLYDVLDKLFEDDIFEFVIPEGDKTVKDNVDKIYEILIKEFPILKEFGSQKIFIDKESPINKIFKFCKTSYRLCKSNS